MATQSKKITKSARARTKLRIRKKVHGTDEVPRLSVFRSSKHIYAQLISDDGQRTLACASTNDKDVVAAIQAESKNSSDAGKVSTKSIQAAKVVGKVLAQRAAASKFSAVVFDRNGFIYTGRVQALADGAREGGLKF